MDRTRLLGNASALRTRSEVFALRGRAGPAIDPGTARLRAALSPHGVFRILDFGFAILDCRNSKLGTGNKPIRKWRHKAASTSDFEAQSKMQNLKLGEGWPEKLQDLRPTL